MKTFSDILESDSKSDNPNIDYTNVMANKEAQFTENQVQKIIMYYYNRDELDKAMLFMVLARTGRRISEIIGMPQPYIENDRKRMVTNYKGLRPIDIKHNQKAIEFDILKKNYVRKKNRSNIPRDENTIKNLLRKKKPKRVIISIDDFLYIWLVKYIEEYDIQKYQRLFPISWMTADRWLKEACKACKIEVSLETRKYYNPHDKTIIEIAARPHLHMFRHTYAITILNKNPYDPSALPKLKKLLQHSRMEITEHYLQFSQKDTKKFLNKTFKDFGVNKQ